MATPTALDVWFISHLARLLGRYPLLDLTMQSAVNHNVLGGVWYGMALFVLWVRDLKADREATRLRVLTIMFGTVLAILLALIAGYVISWLPPNHSPGLERLYPEYLNWNPNSNCFPSQSVTLYTAVAAGIYSLHRPVGRMLWAAALFIVALPRMYLGGHWPSDVLVACVFGPAGYFLAHRFLESRLVPGVLKFFERQETRRIVLETIVYLWILQVATEFRDVVWLNRGLRMLLF